MSLLYWTMLPWLCAVPLVAPAAEAPRPLLLLAEPGRPSFEQQAVQQALTLELLTHDEVRLVAEAPVPTSVRKAAALRRAGEAQLARGWARMRALRPEAAAVCAAMATQKFSRVAARTGDVGPLVDALALQAAAYLHAGAPSAAGRVLAELLALRPAWAPEGWLYNPDMQRAVARARRMLQALPRREVALATASPQAAVFVDGTFAGFGDVKVLLGTQLPHYLWVQPRCGEAVGTRLIVPTDGREFEAADVEGVAEPEVTRTAPRPLHVQLRPHGSLPGALLGAGDERFASVFAAAHASEGLVEPSLPALAAAGVREVWVLGYGHGKLTLTCFDLTSGRRAAREVPAVVTELGEARELARTLYQGEAGRPAPPDASVPPGMPLSPALEPLAGHSRAAQRLRPGAPPVAPPR